MRTNLAYSDLPRLVREDRADARRPTIESSSTNYPDTIAGHPRVFTPELWWNSLSSHSRRLGIVSKYHCAARAHLRRTLYILSRKEVESGTAKRNDKIGELGSHYPGACLSWLARFFLYLFRVPKISRAMIFLSQRTWGYLCIGLWPVRVIKERDILPLISFVSRYAIWLSKYFSTVDHSNKSCRR